jgi:hypothetical protein
MTTRHLAMTDRRSPSEQGAIDSPRAKALRRAKRLLGPTLGVFGLDSDGHLVPPTEEAEKGMEARVQEADAKDDHARLAIAEAELATERSENQQERFRPAPLKR